MELNIVKCSDHRLICDEIKTEKKTRKKNSFKYLLLRMSNNLLAVVDTTHSICTNRNHKMKTFQVRARYRLSKNESNDLTVLRLKYNLSICFWSFVAFLIRNDLILFCKQFSKISRNGTGFYST